MKISDEYLNAIWHPTGEQPAGAIFIAATFTGLPGAFWAHRHPCPVCRTWLVLRRCTFAIGRWWKFGTPYEN